MTRGFFMETWEARKFAEGGIDADFVQDNHSRSQPVGAARSALSVRDTRRASWCA